MLTTTEKWEKLWKKILLLILYLQIDAHSVTSSFSVLFSVYVKE